MFSDPLSIAANVCHAYLAETGINRWVWLDVTIRRLLHGDGWIVTASQSTLLLDKYMTQVA